jgi:hypothetical protein
MTTWSSDELTEIGAADELEIASRRRDGTLRNPVTIWVVPHGDDLYVRSVNGPDAAWFRGTRARHEGRIRAGGVEKDVGFVDADHGIDDATIRSIMSPDARATTIKLVPRSTGS